MADISWTVESVDQANSTMVVHYTNGTSDIRLNIPMPRVEADVETHIASFSPAEQWKAKEVGHAQVTVGQKGTITQDAEVTPDAPQVTGSWNEEYIRALIYQVLEEINHSKA